MKAEGRRQRAEGRTSACRVHFSVLPSAFCLLPSSVLYSSFCVLLSPISLPDRQTPQQILQVLIPPTNASADDERGVIERVVHAGGEEDARGEFLFFAQRVFAEEADVRVVVAAFAEVERLAGDGDAVIESIVRADAAGRIEEADAHGDVVERPSRLRGDEEVVIEARLLDRRRGRCAGRFVGARLDRQLVAATAARILGELDVIEAVDVGIWNEAQRDGRSRVAVEVIAHAADFLRLAQTGEVIGPDAEVELHAAHAAERVLQLRNAAFDRVQRAGQFVVSFISVVEIFDRSLADLTFAGYY